MPRWSDWEPIRRQVAIGGAVIDASGVRVPWATVTVEQIQTDGAKRNRPAPNPATSAETLPEPVVRSETRSDGSFYFLDLPDGTYTVKAAHPRHGVAEAKATVTRSEGRVRMASAVLQLVQR